MAEIRKRKTRMYEPWGYRDENNYESAEIIHENDLDSYFADVNYNKDDNKIHFLNKDGEEKGTLDVSEFVKSDSIIDKVEYKDGILTITFTNGDEIHIDLSQLIDENEFKDGLIVDGHVVKVLVDDDSERWLTVSENGVKVSGIQDEIDRLDDKIDDEVSRATSEEERIETKLNQEIQDRIADVDAEETRAISAETVLDTKINAEEARAKAKEDEIKAALDAEIARSTREDSTHDDELRTLDSRLDLTNAKLDAEITRSTNADTVLENKITAEETRAKAEEDEINGRIDDIISGDTPIAKLEELIEKLGYKDNETLTLTNEHEVAFGEWNISHTSEDASGQTIFSVGNGTSESEKSNAIEIMKNGDVYLWVEGDFMNINKLLGQLAHEVYDTD